MNFGALSFLNPSTGFRNTATRSEFDVSGAKSPTKMLYSFCWFGLLCATGMADVGAVYVGVAGAGAGDDAQFRTKDLLEFGIVSGPLL